MFSYVVLGAGFFTTQTAQATIHTGIAQTSSSLEVVGNVMAIKWETTYDQLDYINVSVALSAGGTPMDMSQMVISYADTNGGRQASLQNNTAGITDCTSVFTSVNFGTVIPPYWCVSQKINDLNPSNPNNLIEPNEIWILSIQTPATATVNQKITINLQPAVGAVMPVTRTLPGAFSTVQAIY